jgi:predicted ATPase
VFQLKVLKHFDQLHQQMIGYIDALSNIDRVTSNRQWFTKLNTYFGRVSMNSTIPPPKGIYLHGGVGCGKTMLMDLFYETCQFNNRKRRIHFHSFMNDVHQRMFYRLGNLIIYQFIEIHELKLSSGSGNRFDPIPAIADRVINETSLLCFDEFQV